MQFTKAQSSGIAGSATAALADEVVRAMAVTKIKFALGTLFLAVLLAVGAAAWGWHERNRTSSR